MLFSKELQQVQGQQKATPNFVAHNAGPCPDCGFDVPGGTKLFKNDMTGQAVSRFICDNCEGEAKIVRVQKYLQDITSGSEKRLVKHTHIPRSTEQAKRYNALVIKLNEKINELKDRDGYHYILTESVKIK